MLTEETALRIDLMLMQLELDQRSGKTPRGVEVAEAELIHRAKKAGIGETTIRDWLHLSKAKVLRRLMEHSHELPPHIARRLTAHFNNPDEPELF